MKVLISDDSQAERIIKSFKAKALEEGLEIFQIEPLVSMLSTYDMRRASMADDFICYLEKLGAVDGESIDIQHNARALRVKGQSFFSDMVRK